MKTILACGFNPALQKVLHFNTLVPGSVNRAETIETFASGKGVNFCRALKSSGLGRGKLLQFCGGNNGRIIENALEKEQIAFESIRTTGETRCCCTCIDETQHLVTELIEPSVSADDEECERFLDLFARSIPHAAAAAFCGTLPGKTDPELYCKLAKKATEHGLFLLLDVWKDPGKLFSCCRNPILKINKTELFELTGKQDISAAFHFLRREYRLEHIAITDGPGQAYAFDGKDIAVFTLPVLEKIVNPIGSGDTANAVLLGSIIAGNSFFSAFQAALAAASANCLSSLCGSFRIRDAEEIMQKITMEQYKL